MVAYMCALAMMRGHAASCVLCWRCGANGPPDAFYCPTCGTFLEAPPPPSRDITRPVRGTSAHQAPAPLSSDATPPSGAPPTAERSTQTAGLFYPSAAELQREETQRKLQRRKQPEARDYQPLLTAVSPGRALLEVKYSHKYSHKYSYYCCCRPSALAEGCTGS
ncbi:Double zinc ribbon and ankyrin repeat-containing protein 1 [Liparis tanakae]|uniref:Double zinc ribbon and ankyrin repeat-containing protein 1 n=1 Tax=Liparis tanakae TaxID=230148 RepID=A0A4Z2E320_9TELE|nr:Double zinc ribbon and ankyrin repeat-containing protein 1 [Liparis tanakae]